MPSSDVPEHAEQIFEAITAGGGRLLGERCERTGHYAQHGVYRFEHPAGGRSYQCPAHWLDSWRESGRAPQSLLGTT